MGFLDIFADPAAWAALATLVVMEVVLGIDNLIFISILSNKLPEAQRQRARRVGIGLALFMRLGLLSTIAWLVACPMPRSSATTTSARGSVMDIRALLFRFRDRPWLGPAPGKLEPYLFPGR